MQREAFNTTVEVIHNALHQITGDIDYLRGLRADFHQIGREYGPFPYRSNFSCEVQSFNLGFKVDIFGVYTFEESELQLHFRIPWGAEVASGTPFDTLSLNGVTWQCANIYTRLENVSLQERFQHTDGIIDRAAVTAYLTRIRVLYDNAVPPYLRHRRAGFYTSNRPVFHLMCLGKTRKAGDSCRFKYVPIEVLIIIRRHCVNIDMRIAGLVARIRRLPVTQPPLA